MLTGSLLSTPLLAQALPPAPQRQPTPSGPVPAPVPPQAASPADAVPPAAADAPADGTPSSTTGAAAAPVPATEVEQQTAEGDIIVTGFRRSLANAASNKRTQTNFTDAIFAEDIGKLPDLNIAEALQRIPGVQLGRDVTGEGVQISVRGLGPSFSKILLNGTNIAVASAGPTELGVGSSNREIDLDLFPTEIFTRLTVSKTPTSDLIEGGIAGTVNLVNTRPFDNPGAHINVGAQASLSPNNDRLSPRGSLIASKTWDDWGILVAVAGQSLRYRTDGYETIGYTTANLTSPAVGNCTVATCNRVGLNGGPGGGGFRFATRAPANLPGFVAGAPVNVSQTSGISFQQLSNTYVPRLAREAYLSGRRDRISALFSAEYRPSDDFHITVDALYGHASRRLNRLNMNLFARNSSSIIPVNWQVDENGVLLSGGFANAQYFLEARPTKETVDFINLNPAVSYRPTEWLKVDAQVNFNKSVFNNSGPSFLFDTAPNQGLIATYDNSGGTDFPILSSNVDLNDPGIAWVNDSYRIQRARRVTKGKGAHIDFTIGDARANVKTGYAYDETSRLIQAFDNSNAAQIIGVAAIPNAAIGQYLLPGPDGLLSPSGQTVGIPAFVQPDYDKLLAAANTAQLLRDAPFSATGTQSTPSGFIRERTHGVYAQLNGEAELFARKLRFNAGLRYFHTDQRVTGPVVVNGAITFQTADTSYDAFLPSFNAAFDVTDKLVLRLAGSRTVTRANPNQLLPGVTFSDISAQVAGRGNPDLKPYFSNNADAGLEYYFNRLGFVSFNYFNKDIQGFTQTQQITAPFSTLGIPLESLSPTQLATGITLNTPIIINSAVNVGTNLTIRGQEYILQQQLDFLTDLVSPALRGFGVTANYTHINQNANGSSAVALGIAPNLYTLGGYFENYGASLRLNYTWAERNIVAIAPQNNIGLANIADSRGQLDLAANYTPSFMNKAFQITFNVLNLTNEPLRTSTGFTNQPFSVYYPGRQFLLGLRARY